MREGEDAGGVWRDKCRGFGFCDGVGEFGAADVTEEDAGGGIGDYGETGVGGLGEE